jgi:hypothetical protein
MKRFLMTTLVCWMLLVAIVPLLARSGEAQALPLALNLANNGQTEYVIALAADAIPAEKTAAEQLQKYLREVTGATLPIKPEGEVLATAPQILVGAGPRAKAIVARKPGAASRGFVHWNELGHDGIVIWTEGRTLVLAGGRPRGTLYAVFQFLEESVGCRWWTRTESTIPRKPILTLLPQNRSYVPPFEFRENHATDVQADPVFATILRENGHQQTQSVEWGSHYNILGYVHTFSKILPPTTYFKEHPEWYSDPRNNNLPCTAASVMPAEQEAQLCVTNPEVAAEFSRQALAWIEKDPEAGYISVSQNDNRNYCRCPRCAALFEQEGSQSGPNMVLVNAVAEKVKEKYPAFWVETLAYHGSETPPKTMRPASNVVIRLAPLGADYGHPLNSEWNATVRDNLLAWAAISPRLFLWNYVTNFTLLMMPYPNWDGLRQDLRFFERNKVRGVFEQGDAYTNNVGDFTPLRTWLIGKLLWDPYQDQNKLVDEFLNGYYGAAGPHLRRYLDGVEQAFKAGNRKLPIGNRDFSFLSLGVMNEATRAFDSAAAAVKDDAVLTDRVRRARLSLDLAWLYRYTLLKRTHTVGQEFLGPADPFKALDELVQTAQSYGVGDYSERSAFAANIPALRDRLIVHASEPPAFAKEYPVADVLDFQQDALFVYEGLAAVVDDAAASDGKAASFLSEHPEWTVQANMSQYLDNTEDEQWRVYLTVRAVPKAGEGVVGEGAALEMGIYDDSNAKDAGKALLSLGQIAGNEYKVLDLGTYGFTSGKRIWFMRKHNSNVENIYIDRVTLIRERPG